MSPQRHDSKAEYGCHRLRAFRTVGGVVGDGGGGGWGARSSHHRRKHKMIFVTERQPFKCYAAERLSGPKNKSLRLCAAAHPRARPLA